jgi:hypothetical protein
MASMLDTPSQGSTSAISVNPWDQGMLRQTSDAWPSHSNAGPSNQATSMSFDQNQGLMVETSPQTVQVNPAYNDPLQQIEQAIRSRLQTYNLAGDVVTSGTLEGLVQFLIIGFSEQSTVLAYPLIYTHNL